MRDDTQVRQNNWPTFVHDSRHIVQELRSANAKEFILSSCFATLLQNRDHKVLKEKQERKKKDSRKNKWIHIQNRKTLAFHIGILSLYKAMWFVINFFRHLSDEWECFFKKTVGSAMPFTSQWLFK